MELSIVVPIYNEADNLEPLAQSITSAMAEFQPDRWEVILVNDGSSDNSQAVLNRICAARPEFRALQFVDNQGQTAAIDAGIRHAAHAFVLTMDADLQNSPADIGLLARHMVPGVGCVCGVRRTRNDPWIRAMSSRVANYVRNKLSKENITDTGCSLKLFRAEALAGIRLYEGMHRFFPTLIKLEGYTVIETPVSHHPRLSGQSKYGVWNRVFKSFFDLLAVRWMKKRQLRYQIKNEGDTS